MMIKAVSHIISSGKQIRLFIIGKGPERTTIEKLIHTLELEKYVTLLGYVDDPYPYYKHADLFIMSSVFEGFGNVLVEALATGTNILATDCPSGPSEIIGNNQYGTLIHNAIPTQYAEAIVKSLEEKAISPELCEKRAKDFCIHKITKQYLQLINQQPFSTVP